MNNLNISPTKSSPFVSGNIQDGTLEIKGNCYPENSILFFEEIMKWMDHLPKTLHKFSLICELNYIASSSVMHFYKLIQKTEEIINPEKVKIIWKYEEDDEDIQNLGEEFQKLSNGVVELISIEVD
tara:strand:- start:143 stop:520 length:378 start_codon:yes stop_codon:yes gene_type:complete